MSTAILVDVTFFLRRFRHVYPNLNQDNSPHGVPGTQYLILPSELLYCLLNN